MKLFQRNTKLKDANYLDLRPIRKMTEEVNPQNYVTVLIPKFTNQFAKKYLQPLSRSPFIKLQLDELGSASWLAIDGVKNVGDICTELVGKFGNKIQPVEERLTEFLTQLYEHRLITFEELKGD
jgi:hypothetical protein